MNKYVKKQFIIGFIYLIIIAIIIFGIYYLVSRPSGPTCNDGIKNQNEDDIDCGGPCKKCENIGEIKILDKEFIQTVANSYDLVVRIKNPNIYLGGETANYKFSLYDENNQLIGVRTGKTYILAQETKYIIETRVGTDKTVSKMDFEITNIVWKKISEINDLEIRIKNTEYQKFENSSKLVGVIENKTSYNFDTIEIVGILFDENGKIIAVSKTSMNTILMNESRGFEMTWPYTVLGFKSFDVRAYTDVFSIK
jgi:hypothetical protein